MSTHYKILCFLLVCILSIYTNLILLLFSYIEEDDMLRFMIKEEVELVLPLIEGAETGKISRKAFTEWVVSWNKFGLPVLEKIYCMCKHLLLIF